MNRPETGPMQFPGELMPGFYITYEDLAQIACWRVDANGLVTAGEHAIARPQRAVLVEE